MIVSDIMSKNVVSVGGDTTLRAAAKKMEVESVGFLPVRQNGRLIGVVTDRDIALKSITSNVARVSDIMTDQVFYCFSYQNIRAVVSTMGQLGIRRMPVLDEDRRLVGVVSLSDLTKDRQVWKKTQSLLGKLKMVA